MNLVVKKERENVFSQRKGGSVIPAAVKTPDNKFARIIKPGRILPAVKMPDKKLLTMAPN